MPNHITNILDVSGTKKDVEAFRLRVSSKNKTLLKYLKEANRVRVEALQKLLKQNPNDKYSAMQLKELQEDSKAFVLDFNGTVPMPVDVANTTNPAPLEEKKQQAENVKKYGYGDWYSWACAVWGTKWGAYDVGGVEEMGTKTKPTLRYRFNTAWSPPRAWLEATSKLFPKVLFTQYSGQEGGGAGYIECQDGCLNESDLSDHDWRLEFDEDYAEQYGFIVHGNYNGVVRQYSKSGSSDYSDLNPYLLARLKRKDLPLFVNFEWYDSQKDFENKMKGVSI